MVVTAFKAIASATVSEAPTSTVTLRALFAASVAVTVEPEVDRRSVLTVAATSYVSVPMGVRAAKASVAASVPVATVVAVTLLANPTSLSVAAAEARFAAVSTRLYLAAALPSSLAEVPPTSKANRAAATDNVTSPPSLMVMPVARSAPALVFASNTASPAAEMLAAVSTIL